MILVYRRGVVVITTAQLHSTKPELRFCAGPNPARGVSEIRDSEDLWQWSRLEIRLNAFRRSTIPQKQFINSSIHLLLILVLTFFLIYWKKYIFLIVKYITYGIFDAPSHCILCYYSSSFFMIVRNFSHITTYNFYLRFHQLDYFG